MELAGVKFLIRRLVFLGHVGSTCGVLCFFMSVLLLVLFHLFFSSVQLLRHACLTFCDRMYCSMPDFLVHHQILELTQTHVHLVGDAIQPFYPLSSPSPPAFSLSQHRGLIQ